MLIRWIICGKIPCTSCFCWGSGADRSQNAWSSTPTCTRQSQDQESRLGSPAYDSSMPKSRTSRCERVKLERESRTYLNMEASPIHIVWRWESCQSLSMWDWHEPWYVPNSLNWDIGQLLLEATLRGSGVPSSSRAGELGLSWIGAGLHVSGGRTMRILGLKFSLSGDIVNTSGCC